MVEEHSHAVACVVLGSECDRLAQTVPIERGVHECFRIVAVRVEVGPLALALETACDGVVSDSLLLIAELGETRVAVHEVLHDDHHLHDELPVLVLLLACLCLLGAVSDVLALVGHAVLACPLHSLLKLYVVVDAFCHAADDLGEVDALVAHAEILLEEVRVDDRTGDTHAGRTHREV